MDLSNLNPWWNEGGLWQDADLTKVRSSRLNYTPTPIHSNECRRPGVITLRGPRRAGKTVTVKLLIASLIEQHGWNPRHLCWTTLEPFRTPAQVEEHLRALPRGIKVLLIDEATGVIGWQRVIKMLVDDGTFGSLFIVVTGSSSFDLKKGAERMAGRRGSHTNPDRVLLPMGFGEFCRQLRQRFPAAALESLLDLFLETGGFPFRVEDTLADDGGPDSHSVFEDVLFYEISRRRLDRTAALEVMGRLGTISPHASSYEGFAKALSVGRDTARRYLDALGDSFLVASISSYDTSRGRVAPKKDRKFIWIDPALAFLPYWLRQAARPEKPTLIELAVGAELLRRHEARLFEGLSAPRNVFTWKSTGGNEIDFLVIDKSRGLEMPIEVKYQSSISDWDFQVVERAFGKGTIVTRDVERQRAKATALPAHRFLLGE